MKIREILREDTQINLHDGTNILSKEKVKTGDVLQLNLPDLKVKKVLKFKKGAQSLIIGGAHVGSISTIMGKKPQEVQSQTWLCMKISKPLDHTHLL